VQPSCQNGLQRLNSHPPWLVVEVATMATHCNGKEMLLRVQWVDCIAAWCMTVYTSVRTASLIQYYYLSTSRHGLQEEDKEPLPLDLKLFFGFYLFGPDGMDALIIITIEQCCSCCRAVKNKERCKHCLGHDSDHRQLSSQSPLKWSWT